MGRRSQLGTDQRVEAVLAVLKKEEPLNVVARRYGISDQTLIRWRDDFLDAGRAAVVRGASTSASQNEVARLQRELEEQKQVVGELTIANWALKKMAPRLP